MQIMKSMSLKNLNGGTGKTNRQMNTAEIKQFAEMIKRHYYKRRLWKSNEIIIT